MLAFLEGPDLLIVLAIVVVLFGGSKLPQLARSLGEAKKELDKGMHDGPVGEPSEHSPTKPEA